MTNRELPEHPDLQQYRKQAKDLLKDLKSGDADAIRRLRQHHPRFDRLPDSELPSSRFVLADAQLVIAREHGVESWPKFSKQIEALTRDSSTAAVWEAAKNAVISGDAPTLDRLLRDHAPVLREQQAPPYTPNGPYPRCDVGDARSIIAREHHFENWDQFAAHAEALKRPDSPVAQFETAVEAIIAGDVAALERLLQRHPELIRARSTRKHRAMLLHYVGANGVEGFRQKTPKNAVRVVETLLRAGAEVDAVAEMYGGSTTLGLVATSIHPLRAGVQDALIELLLDHGASIDHPRGAGNGHSAVNGCLANGRPEAAELLAKRGARLDLEGAAGVGRLDVVKSFFNEDGSLGSGATEAQMKAGFNWACEYGRTSVVEFLLQRGIAPGEIHRGETGLHWAAYAGHPEIVRLLLERNAPVDIKDERFGGTPLGWALYGWGNLPPGASRDRYYEVVERLVGAGAALEPEWLEKNADRRLVGDKVRADPRMLAALGDGTFVRRNLT